MKFTNEYRYPDGAKCPKCNCTHICEHDVDEVNGMAVGPYIVRQCEMCGYETYSEEPYDDSTAA